MKYNNNSNEFISQRFNENLKLDVYFRNKRILIMLPNNPEWKALLIYLK